MGFLVVFCFLVLLVLVDLDYWCVSPPVCWFVCFSPSLFLVVVGPAPLFLVRRDLVLLVLFFWFNRRMPPWLGGCVVFLLLAVYGSSSRCAFM